MKNKWDSDTYTRRAQQQGFPARSVFKLEEIQKKYSVIKSGDIVLDIGASPGSWSLFASSILKSSSKIVGVDIKPIQEDMKFSCGYSFIAGDIFQADILNTIMLQGPYSVILSDAAPSTTGNKLVDSVRSFDIAYRVCRIAENSLKKGGNLVLKIFQGDNSGEILNWMKKYFLTTKAFKPAASRKKSSEQYYIGLNLV